MFNTPSSRLFSRPFPSALEVQGLARETSKWCGRTLHLTKQRIMLKIRQVGGIITLHWNYVTGEDLTSCDSVQG